MPAWWLPKARSKGKAKSKARSFDEAAAPPSTSPRESSGSLFSFDSDVDRRVCHPLPRPGVGVVVDQGSTDASASVSSVSSSGSSEETPDLAVYRYLEPVNMPRGRSVTPDSKRQNHVGEDNHNQLLSCSPVLDHQRLANIRISPRKNVTAHGFDNLLNGTAHTHRAVSSENVFSPGSRSPGPGSRSPGPRSPGPRSRGYTLPTSPVGSRVFSASSDTTTGKQDDLRSASHPLPLPPTSPTSPALRPLQSKWKKGKLLGRGTFGHVYAGFNSENGQMCAIKEVEVISDDSNSKECLKQLSQEINLLSQLYHPNIVQYYGSELVDDTLSVFLEYVSGGSIHKLLQDYGPFGEPVIRSYTGQILSGLAYLHGRNTIHRDIKGANILVDPNGEIKLADFGMAKHISSCTSIRSFKGSPYWMAPEVIMNSCGYSLAVDIWSLGCTIIEMASAKPPWNQFTGVQAIFKIGNSKDIPEIPDHMSNDAKNFLKLCLQRDPSSRPTAALLMDHPFVRDQTKTKIATGNAVRDTHPSLPDRSRSPIAKDVATNRSISPLHDRDYSTRQALGYSNYKPKSDLVVRMNMSLPVSPCSSPLRQFRQSSWSCLPSPPHPACALGTAGLGTSSYPLGHSSRYAEHLPDMAVVNGPTLFSLPRR